MNDVTGADRALRDNLHPLVYLALIGFALWFAVAAWGFADTGYTDMLLTVVSGFVLMSIALPLLASRVWRRNQASGAAPDDKASFRDWACCDFATCDCRVSGVSAAVQILLPVAAAAFGMTAFGIVLYFTAHHAT
jgi:hypothetical protein